MTVEQLESSRWRALLAAAQEAAGRAYCPYSGFGVGAALLCAGGEVYTGCNVENVAFGPGNCAERTAIFKAVSEGRRGFEAIAVVGGFTDGRPGDPAAFCMPCGTCRQVLAEFCTPKFEIVVANPAGQVRAYTLAELLPEAFAPDLKPCDV